MKPTFFTGLCRRMFPLAVVPSLCLLFTGGTMLRADDKPAKPAAPDTEPAAGAESERQEGDRLISIVLLLKAPQDLTHKEIAHAISEGTGKKISEADVVSKHPYHLVTVGSDKYIVNNVAGPYFTDCEKLAAEIEEHKLGDSVKESKAWVSVDWVGKADQTDIKPVYQMIGKMAAHLAVKDIVAAYSPDMDEFALWTPEVIKGLEGDDPLAVFDHDAHDDAKETAEPAADEAPKKTKPE